MRSNIEHARLRNCRIGVGRIHEVLTFIAPNAFALPIDSPPMLLLNPAGAVNILMPTSTAARAGQRFTIVNRGGGSITLQTDGGAGFTAAIVITNTQMAEVVCTGLTSQVVGWAAMVAAGTQTSP